MRESTKTETELLCILQSNIEGVLIYEVVVEQALDLTTESLWVSISSPL